MADGKYYWLKLYADFFTSKRIKKLRSIAGGDTYTIIYLKMQLKSLNTDGFLYYDGVMEDFADELALDLDEKPDDVKITIQFLQSVGLLETNDEHAYKLTYIDSVVGSDTASALRGKKYRASMTDEQKEKERERKRIGMAEKRKSEREQTVPNSSERVPNVEKEIEKDIEIEKREREDKEIEGDKRERIDYQLIADMYNDTCVSFPALTSLSDTRRKAIRARLNNYSMADFQRLFEKAEASSFLKGGNDRNWSATFDWMIKDANMAKILDGNYDNKDTHAYKGGIDWSKV